jgi:diguanylate cyclase (GGDEF)-like protein/PAS domain S-box-containing protein
MRQRLPWRVRSLLYLLAAGILVPMVVLQAYLIHHQYDQGQRQAEAEALRLAELTADTAKNFIEDARGVLQTLARRPQMLAKATGAGRDCDPVFASFKEFYPQLSNMSLSTPAGFLVCSSLAQPGDQPLPVAHMDWFKEVYARQEFVVGRIVYGPINSNWISVLAEPVRDASGAMVGALQTPIDLLKFRLVPAAEKLPPEIFIVIFDSEGNILARSRDAERFVGTNQLAHSRIMGVALAQKQGTAKSYGIEGIPRFYGFAPVPGTDWTVLTGINADYAEAGAQQNAQTSMLVGGALALLVLGLVLLLSRLIARPLLQVSHAATQVGAGQLSLRVPTEGPREVLDMATQFNAMLDAIGDAQAALCSSEQRLKLALSGSHTAIWDLDVATGSVYLSEAWSALMGGPREPVQLALRELLKQVPTADRLALRAALRAVWSQGHDEFEAEQRVVNQQGQTLWLAITGRVTERDGQGRASRLLGVIVDVSERKQREAEIHKLAYFDPLTGLPNRRLLQQQLAQALVRARRSGLAGALMFIDLDRFKSINDARGHAMGDALLQSVASRLGGLVRECDTVARMGGDEFVVLATDLSPAQADAARLAHLLAEKIRDALEQPYVIESQTFTSSASIGVTLVEGATVWVERDGAKDATAVEQGCDRLLQQADTAMYRAKAAGRNQIAFFSADMQVEVVDRLTIENDLAQAIDLNQLSVYVQPQVNADGDTVGAELLLRWRHPSRGMVPPVEFIAVAEETGLILRIGDWVLQQACLIQTELRARGIRLPLSVNVSPRQFRQAHFVAKVKALLERHGIAPQSLVFEVTEGLLLDHVDCTIAQMRELAALGVRISIDDFGTGYSSLSYLKRLPLYELKIDKSFVDSTPHELHDAEIVQLVISLAKMLELRVVAEGVERQEQAEFLRQRGCDIMQGYLFARPQPVEDWLALMSR